MTLIDAIAVVLAFLVGAYLIVALLRPERF